MNFFANKLFLTIFAAAFLSIGAARSGFAQFTPDLSKFAPSDAQIVAVLDMRRLLSSRGLGPIARKYFESEPMARDARRTAFFIGSDIRTDWEKLMWASTGGAKPRELTVVQGRFDHKRFVDFVHLSDGVTTERYLNIVLHKIPNAETDRVTVVAFLAENLLAIGDETAIRHAVRARWDKLPPDEERSDTLKGFEKLPPNAFLRVAVADPLTTPEETAQGKSQIKNLFVSMQAADGAEMMAQADAANAETAGQLKTALEALFMLARISAEAEKLFSEQMLKALGDAKFELEQSSVIFKLRLPAGAVGEALDLLQLLRQP
jgi:hypothetical protein